MANGISISIRQQTPAGKFAARFLSPNSCPYLLACFCGGEGKRVGVVRHGVRTLTMARQRFRGSVQASP